MSDQMSLSYLLAHYRPGAAPTWGEQEADILARICLCCGQPGHYQRMLEAHIEAHGLDQGILLGDGRVRDGNHRVVAAGRLRLPSVPLETEEDAKRRWVRDHGPVGWLERTWGDITASEMSWVLSDALARVLKGGAGCERETA